MLLVISFRIIDRLSIFNSNLSVFEGLNLLNLFEQKILTGNFRTSMSIIFGHNYILQTNNSVLYFDFSPHLPIPVLYSSMVYLLPVLHKACHHWPFNSELINNFTISCHTCIAFIHFVEKNRVNRSG